MNSFIKNGMIIALTSMGLFACSDQIDTSSVHDTFNRDDTVNSSLSSSKTALSSTSSSDENNSQSNAVVTPNGDRQFRMLIVSTGVSSAYIKLNDASVKSPSDFHNKDFEEIDEVALKDVNTIEAELRGSPGDKLCIKIYEINSDNTERTIYEHCLIREAGSPQHVEDSAKLQ